MNEADRHQRVISSTPQFTPEEVASRTFANKVRGYAEPEVRSFLKRVADQLVMLGEREEELLARIDRLEEEIRAPRPLNEQELLDALGEETARLLRSAREAGDEIRRKSEERAARVAEEAGAAAEHLRTEVEGRLSAQTREAEARATELVA
ncbi:MAG TPA: DivIVA domain-containing protein, partial [Acidimicrobiia bacterium]|nr:DivIVA domain-containing protein [Acidimicrobiia bacterium]